jgi:hypothetical protein
VMLASLYEKTKAIIVIFILHVAIR